MPKANSAVSTLPPAIAVPEGAAAAGWVVEVTMPEWALERRYFAVGTELAAQAEELVLFFPGILPSDRRIATRRLSPAELSNLRLRVAAVRPYGWALQGAPSSEAKSNPHCFE